MIPTDLMPFVHAAECEPPLVAEPQRPSSPVQGRIVAQKPLGVADLLEIAADRVETIGWYTGPGWYAHGRDYDYPFISPAVPVEARPAWASTHLHIAAGALPRTVLRSPAQVPYVVTQALAEFAGWLPWRIEDTDGLVDVDATIEAYEASPAMTAAEVAGALRECAAEMTR